MRIFILFLGLLHTLAPSQDLLDALADVRAADTPENIREYVNAHPMAQVRANFDDVLEDLKATNQAIHMLPRRVNMALGSENLREATAHVQKLASMLRSSVSYFRRNMENPKGLRQELDVMLNVIKMAILNVIDMIEKSIPDTTPLIKIIRLGLTTLFD